MKLNFFAVLCFSLFSLIFASTSFAADAHEDLTNTSAEKCGKCHETIYEQWSESLHAQSTALKDPIHGTFYRAVVGDPQKENVVTKSGKYPVCLQCHAPEAAKAKTTKLDKKKIYNEGVTCISCHTLTKYKGTVKPDGGLRLGMKAYEYSKTDLQGPMGTENNREHHQKYGQDVVPNGGLMKTSDACMGCHDQRPNANKVSLCQTGAEVKVAGGSSTCQTCHMPTTSKGITSHAMMGGHMKEMVSSGLVLTLKAKKSGNKAKVTVILQNLLPHNFPTGAPFRNFYVKLNAFDKEGKKVWSSTKSHPMKDDKQAMFMYTIGNDKGPSSPPTATKVLGDTRLKPNETRKLDYEIKEKGVVTIKATAYYDLLLNPIKKKFADKLPAHLMKPQIIARAKATL
ncbi:MAG: hypothetical protein KAG28_10490 [Cocleimonas sp.]|nr:hypothetical protein [Cocleimonas sp.]